jgi:uncharacterized protein (TIGR02996 family)
MNHEQAFLEDILANPDEDAPRLVYADWLEENGDAAGAARAEFIRVQYALRDLPPDDPSRPQLEERERDLRQAHENAWLAPLRAVCQGKQEDFTFRRGFVEGISLHPRVFLDTGEQLFRLSPIQDVEFRFPSYDPNPQYQPEREVQGSPSFQHTWEQVTALPLLARLTVQRYGGRFEDR